MMSRRATEENGMEEPHKFQKATYLDFMDQECLAPQKTIHYYLKQEESYKEINMAIKKLMSKKIVPVLNDVDILVTVDFTGSIVLKEKKHEYPELSKREDIILKSSYVRDYDFKKKKVAIFDDGICTGSHTKQLLQKLLTKEVKLIHAFYYIGGTNSGICNLEKEFSSWQKKPLVYAEKNYESETEFQNKYGRLICSFMANVFMPADKDHFFLECRQIGAKSVLDFLNLCKSFSKYTFIVPSRFQDKNKLKISTQLSITNLNEIKQCPYIKLKDQMTFKMRLFVDLTREQLFLVPVIMDFEGRAFPPRESFEKENVECLLQHHDDERVHEIKSDGKLSMREITCLECSHMHLKLEFLEFFLMRFKPFLQEAGIKLEIRDTMWDKIESLYFMNLRGIVERRLNRVINCNNVTLKWTPKDHRFL